MGKNQKKGKTMSLAEFASADVEPVAKEWKKSESSKPCYACDAPKTSVIDDLGSHDESASIVIVGGGPHALAALSALHEGRLEIGGDEGSREELDGTHWPD